MDAEGATARYPPIRRFLDRASGLPPSFARKRSGPPRGHWQRSGRRAFSGGREHARTRGGPRSDRAGRDGACDITREPPPEGS